MAPLAYACLRSCHAHSNIVVLCWYYAGNCSEIMTPLFAFRKQVTCLALSIDGTLLVSGSHDCDVRMWDVPSRQCVRTMKHKAAITNILLSHIAPVFESVTSRTLLPIQVE